MDHPLHVSVDPTGLIMLVVAGDFSAERLEALKADIEEGKKAVKSEYEKEHKPVHVLLDLTHFGGAYTVDAVSAMTDFVSADAGMVAKTACFGGPYTGTAAGEIVAALAGRENIQFFPSREAALTWLASPL